MGIDSPDRCYFKAMLGNDKLQNDICLSTASMSESDFAPKSTKTSNLHMQSLYQDSKQSIVKIHQKSERQHRDRKEESITPFCTCLCC